MLWELEWLQRRGGSGCPARAGDQEQLSGCCVGAGAELKSLRVKPGGTFSPSGLGDVSELRSRVTPCDAASQTPSRLNPSA